jgi:hypothetical protein
MVIVDAPTLGWNVSRVWWSPVVDFIPRPKSWDKTILCPREDIINYSKFIDQTVGVAKLVDAFVFTQRVKAYLKKHFGSVNCCFIFTGGVLYEQSMKKTNIEPSS